jgi:hypothetical protein
MELNQKERKKKGRGKKNGLVFFVRGKLNSTCDYFFFSFFFFRRLSWQWSPWVALICFSSWQQICLSTEEKILKIKK